MSLCVMALLTGALASLSAAVSTQWQASADLRAIDVNASQTALIIQQFVRKGAYPGAVQVGTSSLSASGPIVAPTTPASIVLWLGDTAVSGGHIEPAEMIVIEHDPTAKQLYVYETMPTATMTALQLTRSRTALPTSAITDAATIAAFKTTDYVVKRVIGQNITGARFVLNNAGSKTILPTLEFSLSFTRDGRNHLEYGTVAFRAEVTPQ